MTGRAPGYRPAVRVTADGDPVESADGVTVSDLPAPSGCGAARHNGTVPGRWLVLVALAGSVLAGCGRSDNPTVSAGPTDSTWPSTTTVTTAPTVVTTAATVIPPTTRPAPPQTTTATTATTGRSTTTTPPAAFATGVSGLVTAGPTCGVEPVGRPCPPVPVAGTVEAVDGRGGVAGRSPIDAAGHYALALPPGRYTLRVPGAGPYPSCPDVAVTLGSSPVTAHINCDTGIR
ncbi:MAG: hypothetical protein ACR2MO_12720 [Acidimicrobiales bacterium]